jgi:hypothetical protein
MVTRQVCNLLPGVKCSDEADFPGWGSSKECSEITFISGGLPMIA